MKDDPFKYDAETWGELEAIVTRAGGEAARAKFVAGRARFEKMAGGWRERIPRWNGRTFGPDTASKYQRIEEAARELIAAMDDLNSPQIFTGNDVVFPSLREQDPCGSLSQSLETFSRFRAAIKHVGRRALFMTQPCEKRRIHYLRDRFFADVAIVWRFDLGLPVGTHAGAPINSFVVTSSTGVFAFPNADAAAELVSNVMRRWIKNKFCT